VIHRYLDSGIPLILGISFPQETIGHAIVASGRVRTKKPIDSPKPNRTTAEFYSHILVNDDQVGPNMFMKVDVTSQDGPTGHNYVFPLSGNMHQINVKDFVKYIIIPLPSKVFFTAEKAEIISTYLMDQYCNKYVPNLIEGQVNPDTEQHSKYLTNAFKSGKTIQRTYLTYGWKYKKRALRNQLPSPVKVVVRDLELPKYVWVTEFGTFDSLSSDNPYDRRIFAHSVIDATAKNTQEESVLLFHAPGFCLDHQHEETNSLPELKQSITIFEDSHPYYPKRRGEENFAGYK